MILYTWKFCFDAWVALGRRLQTWEVFTIRDVPDTTMEEIREWATIHVGELGEDWTYQTFRGNYGMGDWGDRQFKVKDKNAAMLFKMRWC